MKAYVVLLGAINVGGRKLVAMSDLRDLLTQLGFAHVHVDPPRRVIWSYKIKARRRVRRSYDTSVTSYIPAVA
jgi:hypothetical protein